MYNPEPCKKIGKRQSRRFVTLSQEKTDNPSVSRPRIRQTSEFGQRLREAFNGAKNVEIARKLGLTGGAVKHYIEGRIPSAELLIVISKMTNCSLDWLLTGVLPKHINEKKTLPAPNNLQYGEVRDSYADYSSRNLSLDAAVDALIEARIAPLRKEITELTAEIQRLKE